MDISASSVIRWLFYPLRLIVSPLIYPPMLNFNKHKAGPDGIVTLKEDLNAPLYIILPPRQQHNFNNYTDLHNGHIEVLPPACYKSPYIPYSNTKDAQCLIDRIKTYQQTHTSNTGVYIIAQSLGSLTAIRALSQQCFEKVTVVLITPPNSIAQLLYNEPVFEILLLMLHLLIAALILIACGHAGLNSLSITGYILSGTAICIAIMSLIYQYNYNHHTYSKWVYYKQCIPDLRQYIDKAASFALTKYFNNESFLINSLLLAPRLFTLILLLILGCIFLVCYIPTKIIHYLSHGLMYSYLWLMDLHHDYQALANKLTGDIRIFHAESDSLLSEQQRLIRDETVTLTGCDHGNISIATIMKSISH